MTTTARLQEKREVRNRAFSDRGPVAKAYRRFLGSVAIRDDIAGEFTVEAVGSP